MGLLEVKPIKAWGAPRAVAPGISHAQASPRVADSHSSKSPFKCPYQFRAPGELVLL